MSAARTVPADAGRTGTSAGTGRDERAGELIRSARFRHEREASWKRLGELVDRVERSGLSRLEPDEAHELATLYRHAVNSLSVAREVSLDASLLHYLEALAARAYLVLYAPQRSLAGATGRFLRRGAPRAVRRAWPHLLVSLLLLVAGGAAAALLVAHDMAWYDAFMPAGMAQGRGPDSTVEQLRSVIYDEDPQVEGLASFATTLFSHNTQVAIFAFALGLVGAALTGLVLLFNGAALGAFVMLHFDKGLGPDIVGWLSIHGVTELSAIVVAGGGGLLLGQAALFPGRRTRAEALRAVGRDAVHLALVAAMMLFVAALLEGFGRQLVQDLEWRLGLGWGIGLLWLAWFLLGGRRT